MPARAQAGGRRIVGQGDAEVRGGLGAAEGGDDRRLREPVLHAPEALGDPHGEDQSECGQLVGIELGMIEDLQPHGLERRRGHRAALVHQLPERPIGVEVPRMDDRAPGTHRGEDVAHAADVEERQRRPHHVVGAQQEAGLGHQVSLPDEGLLAEHRTLRRCSRARRVHDEAEVPGRRSRLTEIDLGVGAGRRSLVDRRRAGEARSRLVVDEHDPPELGGIVERELTVVVAGDVRERLDQQFGEVDRLCDRRGSEDHRQIAVGDDVAELACLEACVHEHRDGADLQGAEHDGDEVGHRRQQDPDLLTPFDAESHQGPAVVLGPCGKLGIGHALVGQHEDLPVGRELGLTVQQVGQRADERPRPVPSVRASLVGGVAGSHGCVSGVPGAERHDRPTLHHGLIAPPEPDMRVNAAPDCVIADRHSSMTGARVKAGSCRSFR